MPINDDKFEFQFRESSKDAKFGQLYICEYPFAMSRADARNRLYIVFNIESLIYINF